MFKFLVYIMFGYMIWKIVQIVSRNRSSSRRDQEDIFSNQPQQEPPKAFKNVQDADFEELPPDDKK